MLTRRLLRRSLALLGVAVGLGLLWQPVLLGVAGFMHVRNPLGAADFIVPVYRDSHAVAAAVGDLYRRGVAPRVVLYRTQPGRLEKLGLLEPSHEAWHGLLQTHGVPADAILTLDPVVQNEVELGRTLRGLVSGSKPLRVIAVAFGPFSRLTRNALRKGLGEAEVDLRMHPVPPRSFDERRWWRSRAAWVIYFDSYCLWLLSFIR